VKEVLDLFSFAIFYIHKLQIETKIDKKYYEELKDVKPEYINKSKIYGQR
jgi:vacuolar-type H+-ATPase subunit C/Vma6